MTASPTHDSNVGGDLDWSQRFELISKIFAAMLALTYVSGYLIATTFLSRFGIPSDASDLLRAKYIYIGVLYWTFVTIIGVLGRAISLLLNAIKASEALSQEEKAKAIEIHQNDSLDASGMAFRWGPLRRWIVLSLVLVPFAVQIVFLDPHDVRAYVALQSILLLSITLYQTVFYREYSKDGYAWGSLYGRWYVGYIKFSCVIGPALLSSVLMLGTAVSPWVFDDHGNEFINLVLRFIVRPLYRLERAIRFSSVFWVFAGILVLFLSFVALFVTLSTENLKWLERNGRAQRYRGSYVRRFMLFLQDCLRLVTHAAHAFVIQQSGENTTSTTREWRTALDCAAFPIMTGAYSFLALATLHNDRSEFNARALGFGTLLLSLIAISNVIIILTMRRDLGVALSIKPKHDSADGVLHRSDRWFVRILMISILYIVSVLGFAYRIYPFVPVQKAGGDYSTAEAVVVRLSASSECSSADLSGAFETSKPYVVLSEDANWIYLAPLSGKGAGGGPKCWRWGAFCNSPAPGAEDPSRPNVYTISRHCVAGLVSVVRPL